MILPHSKQRRRRRSGGREVSASAADKGLSSGAVRFLSDSEKARIHSTALDVLETVGFANAPDFTRKTLLRAGCIETASGRLTFPRTLVEDAIASARSLLVLYGQKPEHDIELTGSRTYYATGCGSIMVVDALRRRTRPMTAADVYDFARLADALDHVDMFHCCGTPTDIDDTDAVDLNLFYACIRWTAKPTSLSWFNGENVRLCVNMMQDVLGGVRNWRARPCISNVCTFVVPPLKFSSEACRGLEHSIRLGMPVQLCSSGQLGATSPVTFAGSIVQTMAEVLGGL
ncbi:MAG: trimethylamine methyltransferase family protein, partial [Roseibium album]|uniref:trimethylamine methyltransferase family protein n=1 Tax=Roseibium album TaxID=311410 RepID=UPI0032EEA218